MILPCVTLSEDDFFPFGGKTRCAFDRSTARRSYRRKTQKGRQMQRQLSRCDISGVYVPVDDVILVCAKKASILSRIN